VPGAVLGAACFAGNLASGRVTYALGVAFGLLGLLALTAPRRWQRLAGGASGALLAGATSPVAGLFAGLAGVALAATTPRRRADGLLVTAAAGLPLAATAVFGGEGGWMNISGADTARAVVTGLVVALLVPRAPVRVGALLSAAGVVAAFAVYTPVGLNATRLATMFALPVVAAYGVVPRPARRPADAAADAAGPGGRGAGAAGPGGRRAAVGLAVVLAALAGWQPPVSVPDLRDAGNPTASRSYFAPLVAELDRRAPAGRVEVPPTRDYWEAAYVGPLARGWLRQLDLARNPLFFDGRLTAGEYRDWLVDNGVSHVALPDAEPSWVGRREAELVRAGLPYLTEVWRDRHWVLYEVAGAPTIVVGARLVAATPAAVTFEADGPGEVLVRVRHLRWLRVGGRASLAPAPGGWTVVRVPAAGRYTLTS
jgi:hypothetical protein